MASQMTRLNIPRLTDLSYSLHAFELPWYVSGRYPWRRYTENGYLRRRRSISIIDTKIWEIVIARFALRVRNQYILWVFDVIYYDRTASLILTKLLWSQEIESVEWPVKRWHASNTHKRLPQHMTVRHGRMSSNDTKSQPPMVDCLAFSFRYAMCMIQVPSIPELSVARNYVWSRGRLDAMVLICSSSG